MTTQQPQQHDTTESESAPESPEQLYDPLPPQEEFWRPPARFGSVPVEQEPLGWDRQRRFERHYPRVNLPTQIIERVHLGKTEPHQPNRLIWGDNLHVMRQIPSNSIDLIYIDPPFFSGRQYNVLWGDNNELRSFNDIWEDGMPGYLIWLNARLFEMKRLLKPTGSIAVHLDHHASHYVKVELDKVFGYSSFINEIIWFYKTGGMSKRWLGRKHDVIFVYGKSKSYKFNPQKEKSYLTHKYGFKNIDIKEDDQGHYTLVGMRDVWDIPALRGNQPETIGYPTQKPEALIERLIAMFTDEDDTVLDCFVGGGTTASAAQRMNRRWIVGDQSRVAIAVTAERLKQQAQTRELDEELYPDFTVEQWGIYESDRLSQMDSPEFREFILDCYGATRRNNSDNESAIHGWRNKFPIWVGSPALDSQASHEDVQTFANAIRRTPEYQHANLREGTMLAWGFSPNARTAADRLRQQESIDVDFVKLKQIGISDPEFREHIVGQSTDRADYSEFLTFVQPPVVEVAWRIHGGKSVTFDAGDSRAVNSNANIINIQWDFDYDGSRFSATSGYSFQRDKNKKPQLRVTHKFERAGKFRVACRVQDSSGGEGTWSREIDIQ